MIVTPHHTRPAAESPSGWSSQLLQTGLTAFSAVAATLVRRGQFCSVGNNQLCCGRLSYMSQCTRYQIFLSVNHHWRKCIHLTCVKSTLQIHGMFFIRVLTIRTKQHLNITKSEKKFHIKVSLLNSCKFMKYFDLKILNITML